MSNTMRAASTTDTPEAIRAALGVPPPAPDATPTAPESNNPQTTVETTAPETPAGDAPAKAATPETPAETPAASAADTGDDGADEVVDENGDPAKDAAPQTEGDKKPAPKPGKGTPARQRIKELLAQIQQKNAVIAEHTTSRQERDLALHRVNALERELAELKATPPKPAAPPEPQPLPPTRPEPQENDEKYANYAEFQKDLIDWRIEQANAKTAAEQMAKDLAAQAERDAKAAADQEAEQKRQAEAAGRAYEERLLATRTRLSDFDQRMEAVATHPVSASIRHHVMHSELGPELLYHLAGNIELVDQISAMAPRDAVVALSKIEARIEAGLIDGLTTGTPAAKPAAPPAAPPKPKTPVSKAPDPMPRVGSAAVATPKTPDEMNQREFEEWRRNEILKKQPA